MINCGDPTCIGRLIDETDADVPTIAMAFVAVDESYGLRRLNDAIDALDGKIDGRVQLGFYAAIQDLLLSRMVWYVRNVDFKAGLEAVIGRFGPSIREIAAGLDNALPQDLQGGRSKRRQDLTDAGVPTDLAGELADLDALVSAPDIVTVAELTTRAIGDAATTFFAAEAVSISTPSSSPHAACQRTIISNVSPSTAPLTRSQQPKEDWPRTCWQPANAASKLPRSGSQLLKRRASAVRSRRFLSAD
jgi:NAD-specific glutamate dehydrogenase